ncbi:hypothetical protein U0070_001453 [Myodes glareolus]|uniref:Uncharacterized protein n=1 Tax=Myodes glareolus TaxID=447135 RepID=A0AAW0IH89_MYOGA
MNVIPFQTQKLIPGAARLNPKSKISFSKVLTWHWELQPPTTAKRNIAQERRGESVFTASREPPGAARGSTRTGRSCFPIQTPSLQDGATRIHGKLAFRLFIRKCPPQTLRVYFYDLMGTLKDAESQGLQSSD